MLPKCASRRILITAGPTHEPIDAVRYIGNRSSGRMGLALAEAAVKRQWPTTLLLGPTHLGLADDSHLRTVRFQTAAELHRLLLAEWPQHDVLIMAAAVADYTPVQPAASDQKITRSEQTLTLTLKPTPDLLADLAAYTRPDQVVIGFALEPTSRLVESASQKLRRKRLDAIVANPLETMDAATITGTVILADGTQMAAPANLQKADFAEWLFESLKPLLVKPLSSARARD